MVMKRNAMRKNLRQSIFKSFGRYIAIVAIIALGSGLFMGLLMTKTDMVATGQSFTDQQNMFDLRLVSSYGWDKEDTVETISGMEGVQDAEGAIYMDLIARQGDQEEAVYRFHSLPEKIDQVALRGGRMPQADNECLADGFHNDDSVLGTTVTISQENEEDSLDALRYETFTVVGYVSSPLYMDMNRGTTSVGSGTLSNYFYIPEGAFDVDYYTEIHVTIPGDYSIYTDQYNDAMDQAAESLEPELEKLAQERLVQLRQEAEEEYADGLEEYQDGLEEYYDGFHEAYDELQDGYWELMDGEQTLIDSEQSLIDGEQAIEDAKVMIQDSRVTLQQSRKTLADAKADGYAQIADASNTLFENYQTVSENMQQVDNGLIQINAGLIELNAGITQLEAGLAQLDAGIEQMEILISIIDTGINTAQQALDFALSQEIIDQEKVEELQAKLDEYAVKRDEYVVQLEDLKAQREDYNSQLQDLYAQREDLESQKSELEASKDTLEAAMDSIEEGYLELANNQTIMENQFASAEAQIAAGEAQLESYEAQLVTQQEQIDQGWIDLEEGKKELEEGWIEYRDGKREAVQELSDARQEINDAKAELADARESIDSMTENTLHILDRTSNVGYNSLDSSSDIVQGVSRVFPVFFLLVASLVCITTMTRMIDEERTQIGTLKALGYSNGAIIGKYMFYSGSGAILGCGVGVVVGSVAFPMILWEAYCIMLYIQPRVVLTMNWPLCIAIVAVYTGVMLFVTWYSCRRTLREEPAELIRPKSPEAGKKILLEYLPFWGRISFLNKVSIRNIFRYRQRLAMMLLGIGGCTALLVTGFGLRDSIVNVVDYQFEEVTHYDLQVYFTDDVTEQSKEEFAQEIREEADQYLFYRQSSVDLEFDNTVRQVYLMTGGDGLMDFLDLHYNRETVAMPGLNEAVLSAGVAEAMDIKTGDTILLRDSDMQTLELTVSGIYENHVYNYCIIRPETAQAQLGSTATEQMALVTVAEGQDVHELGARITELDDVMNVTVSEDVAATVGGMMDALDLVVVVIVFCAGLLAVIVLYNLTNININERIREIATVKVLGFNAGETAAYVFKENLALSAIGSLVGIVFGKLLLEFVMSQIKIDMVWFKALVEPQSYIWAIALTLLSAVVVDFIFYFKLDKINMAEALKSVE